jgi:hypothetical protein
VVTTRKIILEVAPMTANEMFQSALQTGGNLAGVFEYDGDTGYFYLFEAKGDEEQKVVAAIPIVIGPPDFREEDVTILWDVAERMVGLFIRQQLWAVYDGMTKEKYGGNYRNNSTPLIPPDVAKAFEPINRSSTH